MGLCAGNLLMGAFFSFFFCLGCINNYLIKPRGALCSQYKEQHRGRVTASPGLSRNDGLLYFWHNFVIFNII